MSHDAESFLISFGEDFQIDAALFGQGVVESNDMIVDRGGQCGFGESGTDVIDNIRNGYRLIVFALRSIWQYDSEHGKFLVISGRTGQAIDKHRKICAVRRVKYKYADTSGKGRFTRPAGLRKFSRRIRFPLHSSPVRLPCPAIST